MECSGDSQQICCQTQATRDPKATADVSRFPWHELMNAYCQRGVWHWKCAI